MRTLAIHLGMVLCLTTNAQHMPGGVSAPCVWSTANKQISVTDTLPQDTKGFSSIQIVIPSNECENATITSGQILVTSHRVAAPNSGQYINFASDANEGVPKLISVYRRLAETDSTKTSITDLPLTENTDSICESIVYSRLLSNGERQRIDTYLALKYGLTLDQTAPSSYVGSDGQMVWDAVTNAEFSHHIAGLCHDTVSNLYQASATSAETAELLRLTTDTILPMSYIVCSDNNNSLKYLHLDNSPKQLERRWKIVTSGYTPPTINISFDAERIEEVCPLQDGEHYWLAINDTAYKKSTDLGSFKAQYNCVPLQDGMTFTIVAAKGDEQPEIEETQDNKSSIYAVAITPNPTRDGYVNMRIRLHEEGTIKVRLCGLNGNQYATESRDGNDFYSVTVMLPSVGVWIATIESGDSTQSYKLIRK